MKKSFLNSLIPLMLATLLFLPMSYSMAKYVWNGTVGTFDLKIEGVIQRKAKVRDLYYNGSGFFADPSAMLGIKILSDNSIDITGDSTTEVTELSQLNGTRSHNNNGELTTNYSVWMSNFTYYFTANDAAKGINVVDGVAVSNGYVMRRYKNSSNAMFIADTSKMGSTTIQIEGIIDGNKNATDSYFINTRQPYDMVTKTISHYNPSKSIMYINSGTTVVLGPTASVQNSNHYYSESASGHIGIVYVNGGTLNIQGGAIQNNTGNINSGNGSYGEGLGVSISSGTVNMYSGSIRNNEFSGNASAGRGAGVGMTGGTFNFYGGSICNNSAVNNSSSGGGGVSLHRGGTFTMYDGSEIKDNLSNTSGGGVLICTGTFIMNGGVISGNKTYLYHDMGSDYFKGHGGGVFISDDIYPDSVFIMNGGTITGNHSANQGGGVYKGTGTSCKFEFTNGTGTVSGNTAAKGYNDTYPMDKTVSIGVLDNMEENDKLLPAINFDPYGIDPNLEWWMADALMQTPEVGKDYGLVFEPAEGYALPESIDVTIDVTAYQVYTDGAEHREGENLAPMPTFNPETNTLTIPAALLTEETKSVTIAASAVEIIEEPTTEPGGEPTEKPEESAKLKETEGPEEIKRPEEANEPKITAKPAGDGGNAEDKNADAAPEQSPEAAESVSPAPTASASPAAAESAAPQETPTEEAPAAETPAE